jgi:hypothetical protein
MDPAHHRRHRFEWDGQMREWFMPYLSQRAPSPRPANRRPRPNAIWGAMAGMLRNFYRFLAA